jgi:16S rRNA (guanine527-N7)-methyltransferase
LINLIKNEIKKEQIEISDATLQKLEQFAQKLMWWNTTHNITGAKTNEAIVANIIDSLYPIKFVNKPKTLLDVGTGAGFPGLILAIAWQDSATTLAEPLSKRASFLRYMAQDLDLPNVEIFKNRVEKLATTPFELVTSRAVTNTNLLLNLTKNVTNNDTSYLFFKGERVYQELEELKAQYIYDIVTKNRRNYLLIKGEL